MKDHSNPNTTDTKTAMVHNSKNKGMLHFVRLALFFFLLFLLNGCVLTKIVTVPMRLGAAVISIVPGAGNTVHDAIDEAAETVDEVPL